jgi:tetratricopeptide (TPR) repeat protein
MKKMIITGLVAFAAGSLGLLAQTPATPNPTVKSKAEMDAVNALMQQANARNPDGIIKAADDLVTKFSDTQFKEVALYLEATAYQQKHDNEKAQIYAERVLDMNPKNYQASLLVGEILASTTRENDLDKEDKLTRAEKLLNDSITSVQNAPKPNPQLTDAQWDQGKKEISAEAHNDLGLVALDRKKYDLAVTEFKTAQDMDPQPAYEVRLASALQLSGKNDDAVALCDKILAEPNLHPMIRQVAENVKKAAASASVPKK